MPNTRYDDLRSIFSRNIEGSREQEKLDIQLKESLTDSLRYVAQDMRGLDAFLATQPVVAAEFNRKLTAQGLKTQISYTGFENDSDLRSVVETSAPCAFVPCTDVLMEYIYCDLGLHSLLKKIPSAGGCAVKVPLLPPRTGSTPIIPVGSTIALASGLTDDKCIEIKPEKYGEYTVLDTRDLNCNNCVDRIQLKMKQLAERTSNAMHNATFTKLNAVATNVPAAGNLLATIDDMSQAIKTNIQTSGSLTFVVAPVVFDQLIREKDGSGRYIIDPMSIACEGKCREVCFQGNKFIEMDRLQVVANQTTIFAGYFDTYAGHVVSAVNAVDCQDCLDKMNDNLKIGNTFYQEVVIPADFAAAFAKSTITV
jgi:hypothetical protein